MSLPGSPSPPRNAPHIRLNSGTDNILNDAKNDLPSATRQPSSRSLIPPRLGTSPNLRQQSSSNSLYNQPAAVAESAELLLPPKKLRTRRFQDESPMRSPSGISSRRTSWSSESVGSRDSRSGPFASPFDDSRAPSRAGSDDDLNTQTVSEKYNILPSAGLLLFPEDVEKDDWLHNPDPNEKDKRDCDIFSRRGLVNVGGLALITIGVLLLFIGYPILYVWLCRSRRCSYSVVLGPQIALLTGDFRTFVHKLTTPEVGPCTNNPMCINVGDVPLLKNLRTTLIDPTTPSSAKTRTSHSGTKQNLVVCGGKAVRGQSG